MAYKFIFDLSISLSEIFSEKSLLCLSLDKRLLTAISKKCL